MQNLLLNHFLRLRKVSTDTRRIEPQSIFFALKGDNFNGNLFALKALELGAAIAVVDEDVNSNDDRIIHVEDTLTSLQLLARDYRRTLKIPFLAITGSNGKTTTKELIRDVLTKKYRVTATIGNLNNQIGVPLTLLSIPQDCEIAVIEMGANHQEEIKSYCQYAEPNFGMITNIGKAHLEGFGGLEGVKKGKKELFDYINETGGKVFVNTELFPLDEISSRIPRIEYGFGGKDFQVNIQSESPTLSYDYRSATAAIIVNTNLAGAYNLYNVASAIVIGKFFGVDEEAIHAAIREYQPGNNRSQIVPTERNTLIMDAYNANPTSTEHALVSLSKQDSPNKFFILGDMLELGEHGPKEHRKMFEKTKELKLNGIFIGPVYADVISEENVSVFTHRNDAEQHLSNLHLSASTILIKGSRGMQLEKLVPVL